jgi:hypothetical protein
MPTVSFLRIYEAGHEVPFYQPKASLAMFERTLAGLNLADGKVKVTAELSTEGDAKATHTEPFVALPQSLRAVARSSDTAGGLEREASIGPPAVHASVLSAQYRAIAEL